MYSPSSFINRYIKMEIAFEGISWHEPAWEFGHPSLIFKPVVQYATNESLDSLIEWICIDACTTCNHVEDIHSFFNKQVDPTVIKEFEARGWNINSAPKVWSGTREIIEHVVYYVEFYKQQEELLFKARKVIHEQ